MIDEENYLNLVYFHTEFLVLYKPINLSFHNEEQQLGLFSLAQKQFNEKLWPVHRIDKITSGLVIFAKSRDAASKFGKLFESNSINKCYLAISEKKPKKKQGKICGDMKKSRNGNWILLKSKLSPAVTQFNSFSIAPNKRLYVVNPKTGKTHQIRVALKSIGAPILGDIRYGGNESDRTYLHAYRLDFIWNNENIQIKALPTFGEFFKLTETLKQIESLSH